MGKTADFSPRKLGQINVLLQHSSMKQKKARKLNVSTKSVSSIMKKIGNWSFSKTGRIGKCGRKKKPTSRLDCKMKNSTCKRIFNIVAEEGISASGRTINKRLFESGIK